MPSQRAPPYTACRLALKNVFSGADSQNLCDTDEISKLERSGLNEASLAVCASVSSLDLWIHYASVIAHIRVERHSKKGVRALESSRLLGMLVSKEVILKLPGTLAQYFFFAICFNLEFSSHLHSIYNSYSVCAPMIMAQPPTLHEVAWFNIAITAWFSCNNPRWITRRISLWAGYSVLL